MAFRAPKQPGGDLGRAIREMRRRLDLNQTEFAARMGWLDETVCLYELGRMKPGIPRLVQLLRIAIGRERGPILAALEARGISASDLTFIASQLSATAPVSGTGSQPAMSEIEVFSDTPVCSDTRDRVPEAAKS